MSRIEIRIERCKGCLLCTSVCPEGILEQGDTLNSNGYKVVVCNEQKIDKCRGCGFCAEICPDGALVVFKTIKSKRDK
ncbi:4Fe-4S binding protein [Desulfothermus okinawensis JCM 13304]